MQSKIKFLTAAGLIAAMYTVLCLVFSPISYGAVQVRIAEALCVLPYFTPAAVPGLTVGCFLANLLCGMTNVMDIIFGTFATLLGALLARAVRKYKFLVPVPSILANTIILPFVFRFAYGEAQPLLLMMGFVGIGEILSCGVLGLGLLFVLSKFNLFP